MGKKLIILGADFSENGIITEQSIGDINESYTEHPTLGSYTWIFSERVIDDGVIEKVKVKTYSSVNKQFYINVYKSDLTVRSKNVLTITENGICTINTNIYVGKGDYVAYFGGSASTDPFFYFLGSGAPNLIYWEKNDPISITLQNSQYTEHCVQVTISF